MSKQQTAVEWLVQEINKLTGLNVAMDEPIIEQANKMFEEQIIDAHNNGKNTLPPNESAEQYYNETFKSE